ncbi:MAG TPA: DNA starvation/stationary phase protection protein [Phototrophicaceae bacterium]|nr:DNA starvation/stationary phase protection protein [Phototrophicaceae bacterium]
MATTKTSKATGVKGAIVPNLGLDEKARQQVVDLLNKRLADTFVLYTKTLNYHWNLTGPEFIAIHLLLDDQYHDLAESIDEIAERVRKIGGFTLGTLDEFKQNSQIEEQPGRIPDWKEMVQCLVDDHEAVIRQLREDAETTDKLGDTFTNDFVIGLAHDHETMAWKLRAHLENATR